MKNIIRKLIHNFISLLMMLGTKLNSKFPFELLNSVCENSAKYLNHRITYIFRPLRSEQVYSLQITQRDHPKTVVILQGPVAVKDNFTYETIKIYKKYMPQSDVVVSTWNSTPKSQIEMLESTGAKVVLSGLPEFSGMGNINYQLLSTQAGISYADSIGAEYVLKTRTDQRLARPFLLEYLFSLLKEFPLGDDFKYLHQEERIIVAQGTTACTMFVPYFISDFYFFGRIKDIRNYFDYEPQRIQLSEQDRRKLVEKLRIECTASQFHSRWAPEIMFAKNYITQKGIIEIPDTVEHYWKFVKSNLIGVSHNDVQLYWPKYDRMKLENKITYDYYPGDSSEKCMIYTWNFTNWLNLYTDNIKYTPECEELANRPASSIGSDVI